MKKGSSRYAHVGGRKLNVGDCAHHCGRKTYVSRPVAARDHATEEDVAAFRSGRAKPENRTGEER